MKVGDRVGTPPIEGVVIGTAKRFDGLELLIIETEDKLVYMRNVKEFTLLGEAPVVPHEIVPPTPAPPPELPYTFFVPLTAAKAKPMKPGSFYHECRLKYLPERPQQSWIMRDVKVEIRFYGTTNGDIDNLCKPVLDLLKRSVIRDDCQVKGLAAMFFPKAPKQGFQVTISKYDAPQEEVGVPA